MLKLQIEKTLFNSQKGNQNIFYGQLDSRRRVSPVQHFERQEKFVYWRRFDSISLAGVSERSSSEAWYGWNHFALHCRLVTEAAVIWRRTPPSSVCYGYSALHKADDSEI